MEGRPSIRHCKLYIVLIMEAQTAFYPLLYIGISLDITIFSARSLTCSECWRKSLNVRREYFVTTRPPLTILAKKYPNRNILKNDNGEICSCAELLLQLKYFYDPVR